MHFYRTAHPFWVFHNCIAQWSRVLHCKLQFISWRTVDLRPKEANFIKAIIKEGTCLLRHFVQLIKSSFFPQDNATNSKKLVRLTFAPLGFQKSISLCCRLLFDCCCWSDCTQIVNQLPTLSLQVSTSHFQLPLTDLNSIFKWVTTGVTTDYGGDVQ